MGANILWLNQLGINDIDTVGGKNTSLGEMIQNLDKLGVKVPGGFATTAHAYREFLKQEGHGKRINAILDQLDVGDIEKLIKAGAHPYPHYGMRHKLLNPQRFKKCPLNCRVKLTRISHQIDEPSLVL